MKKTFNFLSLIVMTLALIVCALPNTTVNAKTNGKKPKISKELRMQLDTLEKKYKNINFFEIDDSTITESEYLDFSSIEEVDKFINGMNNENQKIERDISVSGIKPFTADSDRISWYAPFSGWPLNGMARWNNVVIDYDYSWMNGRPYYTSYSNVNSYISGIDVVSWKQTGKSVNYSAKYSYRDTADIKVNGYYLLGISINGAPIGFTRNDTWECSLTLVP